MSLANFSQHKSRSDYKTDNCTTSRAAKGPSLRCLVLNTLVTLSETQSTYSCSSLIDIDVKQAFVLLHHSLAKRRMSLLFCDFLRRPPSLKLSNTPAWNTVGGWVDRIGGYSGLFTWPFFEQIHQAMFAAIVSSSSS